MKKEKHNGIISIWKFIFCIVIAVYHGKILYPNNNMPIFSGGYVAVEFFFIVSGFYFAKRVLAEKYNKETIGKETISFIWEKIKRIIPYMIIAYIPTLIIYMLFVPKFTISNTANSIWNLLLLKEMGFRSPYLMTATWYLAAMYFSMFVLYPLVKKHKENFVLIISPIIILLFLGYLSHNWIGLDHSYQTWGKYVSTGLLRGFAEINIGMIIYYINQKLQKIDYTKFFKLLITLLSEVSLIVVLLITSFISRHAEYDYIMLLMISVAILIMMSGKTFEYKLFSNKFFFFLEKISLVVFINHQLFISIVRYVPYFSRFKPIYNSMMYVGAAIVFSIIEYIIINKLKKIDYSKIKKVFIASKEKKTV